MKYFSFILFFGLILSTYFAFGDGGQVKLGPGKTHIVTQSDLGATISCSPSTNLPLCSIRIGRNADVYVGETLMYSYASNIYGTDAARRYAEKLAASGICIYVAP